MKTKFSNLAVGCKYYKYLENNELELIRLVKVKNDDCYVVKTNKDERRTINKEELLSYIKLNPDGYVTIANVGLDQGIQDVIVTLHRMKDIKDGDKIPYAVCRQNIFNMFSQHLEKKEGVQHIGVSVCKDTCPPDVDFKISLVCNSAIRIDVVNIYLDDTIENVLGLINTVNYDAVLSKLYDILDQSKVIGSCKSLKELLTYHDFRADFLRAWNICSVPFKVCLSLEDMNVGDCIYLEPDKLPPHQVQEIEGILKYEIKDHLCIPYDKDICLESIEQDYTLISDTEGKVYVFSYLKGGYINREYESLEDKRDRDALIENRKG